MRNDCAADDRRLREHAVGVPAEDDNDLINGAGNRNHMRKAVTRDQNNEVNVI